MLTEVSAHANRINGDFGVAIARWMMPWTAGNVEGSLKMIAADVDSFTVASAEIATWHARIIVPSRSFEKSFDMSNSRTMLRARDKRTCESTIDSLLSDIDNDISGNIADMVSTASTQARRSVPSVIELIASIEAIIFFCSADPALRSKCMKNKACVAPLSHLPAIKFPTIRAARSIMLFVSHPGTTS